ncbi:MAG: SdrD B-like domain-containing protein [Chloroflexota bacterium]
MVYLRKVYSIMVTAVYTNRTTRLFTLLFFGSLFFGLFSPTPAQAQANLLTNPNFAQPFSGGVANGWSAWHRQSEKTDDCTDPYYFQPRWNLEFNTDYIYEGGTSQYIGNNWDTWSAGVYQTVAATPGTTYRFTFRAIGRTTSEPDPAPSEGYVQMNIRAGIDPGGGTAWNGANVVWGGGGSPHDQWQQFSVEATATGSQITVFTSANMAQPGSNQCLQFLDTWYDTAQLTVVQVEPTATNTPPPPPPPPPATNTPVNTPTPEVTATPTIIPTDTPTPTPTSPPGGTICLNAFHDENANGIHDANEDYMAGITFTIRREGAVIDTAISTGQPQPLCFEGLEPGTYEVAQQIPARLVLTTADTAVISIEAGQTLGLEFGSRLPPQPTPITDPAGADTIADADTPPTVDPELVAEPATPDDPDTPARSLAALSGLIVFFLGVVLLGVLIFFFLRRQTV